MSQAPSVAFAGITEDSVVEPPASVSLKGTTRGLEVLISGTPSAAALGARLTELLAEAPGFFAGSDARIAIDGVLPVGALACLEEVAARFALRLVEIGPVARRGRLEVAAAPRVIAGARSEARAGKLAEGTGPVSDESGAPRRDDPRAIAIPALPPGLRAAAETASGSGSAESSPVSRPAPAAASDALVSAATALVTAAAALTNESSGSRRTTETAGAAASPDAACSAGSSAPAWLAAGSPAAGSPAAASLAAGSPAAGSPTAAWLAAASPAAGSPAGPQDAACKAASLASDTVCHAGSATGPRDAACKAASAGPGDPAVMMALAAVLAAIPAAGSRPADDGAGPRLVIGPVRSGRIVDHVGHLIVIGDVNPGAEVRAEGSILVLGRMRGVAHAAIGRDAGFIIALSLQPQQLRIGRMVARAGDADRPSGGAEIAYVTGETIVVERFSGRLPSGLAAGM